MIAMVFGLTALLAYYTIGWALAVRELPDMWRYARRKYPCYKREAIRTSVRFQFAFTVTGWPLMLVFRGTAGVARAVGAVVDSRDPELPAVLKAEADERLARLEQEAGLVPHAHLPEPGWEVDDHVVTVPEAGSEVAEWKDLASARAARSLECPSCIGEARRPPCGTVRVTRPDFGTVDLAHAALRRQHAARFPEGPDRCCGECPGECARGYYGPPDGENEVWRGQG